MSVDRAPQAGALGNRVPRAVAVILGVAFVALGGVGIGSALHSVSHVIGRGLGGTPETDIPTFGLMTVLLVGAAWLRWRAAGRVRR